MNNDSPQIARYPMGAEGAGSQYPGAGGGGRGIAGANPAPLREAEVHRELNQVARDATTLKKMSEELVQRLASVVSPRDNEVPKNPEQIDLGVATPLATNIREIHKDLEQVQKMLNLILLGLEL